MVPRGHDVRESAHIHSIAGLILFGLSIACVLCAIRVVAEDGGPPLIVSTPIEDLLTNTTQVDVTGNTDPDTLVFVEATWSGGSINASDTADGSGEFNITVQLAEGFNRVVVKARHPLGGTTNVTRNVTVDTVPPILTISSPKDWPTYTRHDRISIVGQVVIDPEKWDPGASTFHMERPLLEGENMIDVRFSDDAGNEVVEWVYVITDWRPPELQLYRPNQDPFYTNVTHVEMSGTVGTEAAGVRVVFNDEVHEVSAFDGDLEICATWRYVLELGPIVMDGPVEVIAYDHVGNVDTAEVEIVYDDIPPNLQLGHIDLFPTHPFIWINGTVDEEGINMVFIQGVPYPVIDGRFSIQWSLELGLTKLIVSVQDRAGNVDVEELMVIAGTGGPYLEVSDTTEIGDGRYRIKGSCTNYIDVVTIDGMDFPAVDGEFTAEIDAGGKDKVLVSVEDPGGRVSTVWVDLDPNADLRTLGIVFLLMAAVTIVIMVLIVRSLRRAGRQG